MPSSIAEAFVTLRPDVDGFRREMSRGVDSSVDDSARRISSGFGGAFRSAAGLALTAFAGLGAVSFFSNAVSGASDLAESISKVNTVFGEHAAGLQDWSTQTATRLGLSRRAALDLFGTFGNMFTQLGIGQERAADMSVAMADLAADLSSFHNADISDVIDAQSAAFRGEYDSVQRFIPTINAAAVETKALAMTGKENADQLTAQEKALATQTLMMEGAGAAMGDFARTSDGLANKQRILSAQWTDAKDKLGTALLPVLSKVTGAFSGIIQSLAGGGDHGAGLVVEIGKLFGLTEDDERLTPFINAMERAEDVVGGVIGAVKAVFTGLVEAFSGEGPGGQAINRVATELLPRLQEAFGALRDFAVAVFTTIRDFVVENRDKFQELGDKVTGVMTTIVEIVTPIIETLTTLWQTFGDNILAYVVSAFDAILTTIQGVLDVIKGVINVVLGILTGDWSRAWDGIKQIVQGVWEIIQGVVDAAINAVKTAIGMVMEAIGGAWSSAWNGIKDLLASVWEGIKSAVGDGVRFVVDTFLGMVEAVVGGAEKMFGWVPFVGDKLGDAKRAIEVFRDQVNAALGGIQDREIKIRFNLDYGSADAAERALRAAQPRAMGGPVTKFAPYLVGERGPELFIPDTGGTVVPNGAGGPGGGSLPDMAYWDGVADRMGRSYAAAMRQAMRAR